MGAVWTGRFESFHGSDYTAKACDPDGDDPKHCPTACGDTQEFCNNADYANYCVVSRWFEISSKDEWLGDEQKAWCGGYWTASSILSQQELCATGGEGGGLRNSYRDGCNPNEDCDQVGDSMCSPDGKVVCNWPMHIYSVMTRIVPCDSQNLGCPQSVTASKQSMVAASANRSKSLRGRR